MAEEKTLRDPTEYEVENMGRIAASSEAKEYSQKLDLAMGKVAEASRGGYAATVGSIHLSFVVGGTEEHPHGIIKLCLFPEPPDVPQLEVQKTFYKIAIQSLQEDLRDLEAREEKARS
jgi:hypothetical protein